MEADIAVAVALIPDPLSLAGLVLVAGSVLTRLTFGRRSVASFPCHLAVFAGFTVLLSMASVSPFSPTAGAGLSATYVVVSSFKIASWMGASWLLAGFVCAALVFKRQPKDTKFVQDLCAGAIYVGALLGIVTDVFDVPVRGLLAASGVIAIVLGLALQNSLGDVFSGVVLNLAKPYRPGDWVILDGGLEGRVVETNWRATELLTRSNDLAVIPDSLILRATLVNASEPTQTHGVRIVVRLGPAGAPATGVSILETALLSCTLVLRTPPATVFIRSLDAVALECELMFFVRTFEEAPAARNEVFDRAWRYCASAGIRLAPPADGSMILPPHGAPRDPGDAPRRLLERLPIFLPLSNDERLLLAPKMKRRTYKAGDILLERDVVTQALFILGSGALVASQTDESGEVEVLRYAPGDCFGQASVLTGAATAKVTAATRAVVYSITKDDLTPTRLEAAFWDMGWHAGLPQAT